MSNITKKLFALILLVGAVVIIYFVMHKGNPPQKLFKSLSPDRTGINFVNRVKEGPGNNILEKIYFYDGGGVSIGDINNDGLDDLYFTANSGPNALYLNLGNFRFKNITIQAGVADSIGWSTGTTMVDINGDGLLDIYVCKTGSGNSGYPNKLFINNGDLTFTEKAAQYGLDDPGYGTQAAFFDYDHDGDLDAFIVNYSAKKHRGFNLKAIRSRRDPYVGDKLYRNDNGTFTDVSKMAGILQNSIGYGLSVTISDLNMDGWMDIYVTNDFLERDYMYINQKDGTFRDESLSRTNVTTYSAMGADIADINNDGVPGILVVGMRPYDYSRRRVFRTPDYSIYDALAANNYNRQNMRNVLQINNGRGFFTEAGQLAGISATDWSWAPLITDFDNDGRKDIFITNGFPRFLTNLDYLHNILWAKYPEGKLPKDSEVLYKLVLQMPQVKLHNFAFKNTGHLSFVGVSKDWGLNQYSISNGVAYGDLNNDGALDLVVNNFNAKAFVFKNRSQTLNDNNYLKIILRGSEKNTYGYGTKVLITGDDDSKYYQEVSPTRGFQSSVSPELLFGLGSLEHVNIKATWPDQSRQVIQNVSTNQTITIFQKDAKKYDPTLPQHVNKHRFVLLNNQAMGLNYKNEGGFKTDRITAPLMPHTLTNLGPALAKGDVNKDGLTDLFIGGGHGQPAELYLQQPDGTFFLTQNRAFEMDKQYVDIDALFFDANGDGSLDLYVVSGGNFDPLNGPAYQDRLYINNGFGQFTRDTTALPEMESSGSTVTAININNDGQVDLFIGGRVLTGRYPLSPRSYILKNNNGRFTDVTKQMSPKLLNPGMVTDAAWADINNDDKSELVITGEWMPIRIFEINYNTNNFTEITKAVGLDKTSGWWHVLKVADINGDDNVDIIAGNRGLNASLGATIENPVSIFVGDFNNNGFIDPIITQVIQGHRYPVVGRNLLLRQLPNLKNKFPTYTSYAAATIKDILTHSQRQQAVRLNAYRFASTVFKNNGNGTFKMISLPREAQVAPIYAMIIADFNGDNRPDILAAGNNFGNRPEMGPFASDGILLLEKNDFKFIPKISGKTGFYALGDIRNMKIVHTNIGTVLILARNNGTLITYLYQNNK